MVVSGESMRFGVHNSGELRLDLKRWWNLNGGELRFDFKWFKNNDVRDS